MVWLCNQVRYLPQDIEAHVVCDRTDNPVQFSLPDIHCLSDHGRLLPAWDMFLRLSRLQRPSTFLGKVIAKNGIQLLHSHFGHLGWMNLPTVRRVGARHVVSFYGLDVNYLPKRRPVWRRRYADLFAQVDAVFCEGPHMGDCVADLGCPREKIHVQRLGVAVDQIPFRPCPWRPGDPLRVLMAASFREKKGLPVALRALARAAKHCPLQVTLVGGPGTEPRAQPEAKVIMSIIEQESMRGYLNLTGFLPHEKLMDEAQRHHVFLSPSQTASDGDTEGGAPISLIDMAASGLVLLSTQHCDIPQIIEHRVTGLLSEERDVDGLVANLMWLVEHPERWEPMRLAARRHVELSFDAVKQGARQAAIYRDLLR